MPWLARYDAPAWLMPTPWPQPVTVKVQLSPSQARVKAALRSPKAVRSWLPVTSAPPSAAFTT